MFLTLLTPEKTVFDGETNYLQAPGSLGLMGLLNNHAPIISELTAGVVKYVIKNNPSYIFISGGYLEFFNNRAVVLADAAEKPEEINIERVHKALERARKRLKEKDGDIIRAKMAIIRALGREKAHKSLTR